MRKFFISALFLALALAWTTPVMAEKDDELKENLEASKTEAEAKEQALLKLTEKEKSLHKDLAEAEERMTTLAAKVEETEKVLAALRVDEEELAVLCAELEKEKKASEKELAELVTGLWPMHVQGMASLGRNTDSWQSADRQFAWLAAVYRSLGSKLTEVRAKQVKLDEAVAEKRILANQAAERLAQVNKDKDLLLGQRIEQLARIQEIRHEKLTAEEELDRILATVKELNYQLENRKAPEGAKFSKSKGKLPWPAQGKLTLKYAPRQKPPRKGVGLTLEEGDPVKAVWWGKVVHDGVLRGFGRVIIVLHDEEYYSLYAFLSESKVRVGQEVAQGQTLGNVGFYPDVEGAGLYFELRFHQKVINPETWLAAAE